MECDMKKIFTELNHRKFKGNPIAYWSLLPIFIFTIIRSLLHIFLNDGGAQSIATIPLNSFSVEAQNIVIQIFGLWGLSQLITVVLEIVIFIYHNDFIPLIYLMLITEYAGRLVLGKAKPIILTGTAPGAIGNYVLIPIFIILLVLSLKKRKE
jgi:hypothetical protein